MFFQKTITSYLSQRIFFVIICEYLVIISRGIQHEVAIHQDTQCIDAVIIPTAQLHCTKSKLTYLLYIRFLLVFAHIGAMLVCLNQLQCAE